MTWNTLLYLSLYSGICGGDLGLQHLLGWECAGYVEWDDYCVKIIEQRIKDGLLSDAPIFHCDIREFNQNYAETYRGISCITAGFPCQPFSSAGKQLGAKDSRNMWPATIESIRIMGPGCCYLENVKGILWKNHGYFGQILGDLAECGYNAKWCCLPAYITGAPQNGARVWIMVSPHSKRLPWVPNTGRYLNLQTIEATVPNEFWITHPGVYRRSNGISNRVDRIKSLGNGQVPALAAAAWKLLNK